MSKKNVKKQPAKASPILNAVKIIMLLLTLRFSCAMPILAGAGLIYNRAGYGNELAETGIFMIVSAVCMTVGAILCLFRRNLPNYISPFLSVGGLLLCLIMLNRITGHADASGWTDKYTLTPISEMYSSRIMPCILPAALAAAISVIQLCSYELSQQRRSRKEKNNGSAPPII